MVELDIPCILQEHLPNFSCRTSCWLASSSVVGARIQSSDAQIVPDTTQAWLSLLLPSHVQGWTCDLKVMVHRVFRIQTGCGTIFDKADAVPIFGIETSQPRDYIITRIENADVSLYEPVASYLRHY